MTTHGDAISQHGGVPVGGGMLPIMGYKSREFYVHGSAGVDGGNRGTSPRRPLKTLTAAYGKMVDGRGDVAHILNDGSAAASVRDVALVWAKDNCHIIGHCAPAINNRSRIAPPTGSSVDVDAYTPYLTLSASGCIIKNVSWFQGQSEDAKASVGILCSGSRNYFENVSIITGAAAHQGDEVCYNLQLTGSENVFQSCYIGQDTMPRSNFASANVRFGADSAEQATRNIFSDCKFTMFADGAGPIFIATVTAFDTQRWNLFERCNFLNTGTSTITQGVSWADTTGMCFLKDCAFAGLTDITTGDSAYVQISGSAIGSANDTGMYGTATTS
jgi:hypothetical protein